MLGELGKFGDQRLDRCGIDFLERMIGRKSTSLRQLAGGHRSDVVGFGRFLANPRVTVTKGTNLVPLTIDSTGLKIFG